MWRLYVQEFLFGTIGKGRQRFTGKFESESLEGVRAICQVRQKKTKLRDRRFPRGQGLRHQGSRVVRENDLVQAVPHDESENDSVCRAACAKGDADLHRFASRGDMQLFAVCPVKGGLIDFSAADRRLRVIRVEYEPGCSSNRSLRKPCRVAMVRRLRVD